MVTTTMPRSASFAPSYSGSPPDPPLSAPPCIQKNTGAFFALTGAQTFRNRQSSLVFGRVQKVDAVWLALGLDAGGAELHGLARALPLLHR
jgi:hypothetical protein